MSTLLYSESHCHIVPHAHVYSNLQRLALWCSVTHTYLQQSTANHTVAYCNVHMSTATHSESHCHIVPHTHIYSNPQRSHTVLQCNVHMSTLLYSESHCHILQCTHVYITPQRITLPYSATCTCLQQSAASRTVLYCNLHICTSLYSESHCLTL